MTEAFRTEPGAIVLAVRLTPRSARDAVDGIGKLSDGRAVVLARVRAVPERGVANLALEKLIGATIGVPRSRVSVVAGASARIKQVRVAGDAASLARVVASWPSAG